jgi:DNA mismatch repair protein MutL
MGRLRRVLPRDRHPICFLHVHLPAHLVDWNRHPAKAEIYIQDIANWQTRIVEAIDKTLQLNQLQGADSVYQSRIGSLIRVAEAQGGYRVSQDGASLEPEASRFSEAEEILADSSAAIAPPPTAPPQQTLKALTQVHQMYILAEHSSGMWLVEQHIAHERVLYEQLRDRWQPIPVEPPIILNHLTESQVTQLKRIGLDIEPFGEMLWAVRTVPEPLASREDCAEALWELSLGGDLESALVATACRTAIRNGTPLSLAAMQSLLDQWLATRNPRTCPHGRPIYLPLEESSLSRFFRRHWVIGKSHGI